MRKERLYTESEVIKILSNLVNGIGLCAKGDIMPERYKQKVNVNGKDKYVTGRTLKDLLEAYLELCIREGSVIPGIVALPKQNSPMFGTYIQNFMKLYKDKQESTTKINRERILKNHILPKWSKKKISDITISDLQAWFNKLEEDGYSHETLMKIKNIMSPAFSAAVEDGYISTNPLSSKRLVVGGTATIHHKAIPPEKMAELRAAIPEISDVRIRMMLALLAYTGMRIEEIFGLRWEDIDFEEHWIYIKRAVVHPHRNQPEIKDPKTRTSTRRIPLPDQLIKHLRPTEKSGFVLYSYSDPTRETPMSYTEGRRVFNKIRETFGIQGYSAHDFRDTCATEWREAGVPVDVISHLLGHSKSDITETRYVKYRDELFQGVREVMNNQNGNKIGQKFK